MKNILFTVISLALLASCSVKSNEEKVRELIEPQIKASLINPETYEFAQLRLDSCFSNSRTDPKIISFFLKVAKLYSEYKGYMSDAERAESGMTVFSPSVMPPSALFKQQQRKYKAEMEKAQRKAAASKEQILQLYRNNKKLIMSMDTPSHELVGWAAEVSFRAETGGGTKTMSRAFFLINKDLTEVTHRLSDQDMTELELVDFDELQYDFEKELQEIFGEQ